MKKLVQQWFSYVPGVAASLLIAAAATLLADLLDRLLGTHLIGAAVIAIGMFISAISKKKWISAVVIYSVLLLLFVLYIVSGLFPSGSLVADALSVISLFGATEELIYGVFDIRAIVYYISIIVVFLLLTVRVLEKKRFA